MTDLVPQESWARRAAESAAEHAWFIAYVEAGSERTPGRAARKCGVPAKLCSELASKHDWAARAGAYDVASAQVAAALVADESEALAAQYAAGVMMLKMGFSAMESKNAALIRVPQAVNLIKEGAEAVRRGAGVADLKVSHETTSKVERMIAELMGENDAEVS